MTIITALQYCFIGITVLQYCFIGGFIAAVITAPIVIPWVARRVPARDEKSKRRPF